MKQLLDTTRIFEDEDTKVIRTIRCVMPYADMAGPFEDVSYLYPDYPHVTAFRDEVGELFMVLEPLQKVLDGWLFYFETQLTHNPINFSAS